MLFLPSDIRYESSQIFQTYLAVYGLVVDGIAVVVGIHVNVHNVSSQCL